MCLIRPVAIHRDLYYFGSGTLLSCTVTVCSGTVVFSTVVRELICDVYAGTNFFVVTVVVT